MSHLLRRPALHSESRRYDVQPCGPVSRAQRRGGEGSRHPAVSAEGGDAARRRGAHALSHGCGPCSSPSLWAGCWAGPSSQTWRSFEVCLCMCSLNMQRSAVLGRPNMRPANSLLYIPPVCFEWFASTITCWLRRHTTGITAIHACKRRGVGRNRTLTRRSPACLSPQARTLLQARWPQCRRPPSGCLRGSWPGRRTSF